MRDALKNYLTLASGLTEVGRQRAIAASKALVAQGEATAEQVTALADDLVQTSKNNRELIATLVRTEVERAMNAVGVATADSVEFLTKRLQTLEAALREAAEQNAASAGGAGDAGEAGDVTSTHELAAPARAVAAKTVKPAASKPVAKAADQPAKGADKPAKGGAGKVAKPAAKATTGGAGDGSAAKPAKAAAKAAKAPAKKAAKKAQS